MSYKRLFNYCEKNDIENFKNEINKIKSITTKFNVDKIYKHDTLLIKCIKYNSIRIAKYLINNFSKLDYTKKFGYGDYSYLYFCCIYKRNKILNMLLNKYNYDKKFISDILYLFIYNFSIFDYKVVDFFINHKKINLNIIINCYNDTFLNAAIISNRKDNGTFINIVLNSNKIKDTINIKNNIGMGPLTISIMNGNIYVFERLLNFENIIVECGKKDIRENPLIIICKYNKIEYAKILLYKKKININFKCFIFICGNNNVEFLELLFNYTSLNEKQITNLLLFCSSIENGFSDCFEYLYTTKNFIKNDKNNNKFLYNASKNGNIQIVNFLLKQTDINLEM